MNFRYINIVKENNIFELIPGLEEKYYESNKCRTLEELLCEMGSDITKNYIYEELKKEYDIRLKTKKNFSYRNLFGEEYKLKEKVINKMNMLSWKNAKDYEIIEKMIEDYNPEIRSKALEILNNASYHLEKDEIIN